MGMVAGLLFMISIIQKKFKLEGVFPTWLVLIREGANGLEANISHAR